MTQTLSQSESPSSCGYVTILMFAVPAIAVDRFMQIHRETALLYTQLGAESVEIYRLADGASKYGCVGLVEVIPVRDNEQLIIVKDHYRNKDEFLRVSAIADQNPAITGLFEELAAIVDIKRATRAEFELAQS